MDKESVVLLPTAYLPPIQWFVYLFATKKVFIEQYETYPKQTYRNRCEIATANGRLALTIPVIKVNGNHTKTKDIEISDHQNWQVLHWRALTAAYANSPYFMYYQDEFEPLFVHKFQNLMDFNFALLENVMKLISIEKEVELTNTYEFNPPGVLDLRGEISPKITFDKFPLPEYYQVFKEKNRFIPGLSIIDLLFNMGPESAGLLKSTAENYLS
jgi:hypothetical protein